jgi:hypothetical protein
MYFHKEKIIINNCSFEGPLLSLTCQDETEFCDVYVSSGFIERVCTAVSGMIFGMYPVQIPASYRQSYECSTIFSDPIEEIYDIDSKILRLLSSISLPVPHSLSLSSIYMSNSFVTSHIDK